TRLRICCFVCSTSSGSTLCSVLMRDSSRGVAKQQAVLLAPPWTLRALMHGIGYETPADGSFGVVCGRAPMAQSTAPPNNRQRRQSQITQEARKRPDRVNPVRRILSPDVPYPDLKCPVRTRMDGRTRVPVRTRVYGWRPPPNPTRLESRRAR